MEELNYYEEAMRSKILKFIGYMILFVIGFRIRFLSGTLIEPIYRLIMLFLIGVKIISDYDKQLKIHNPNEYIFNKKTLIYSIIGITVIVTVFSMFVIVVLKKSENTTLLGSLMEFYKALGFEAIEIFYFTSIFEEIIFRGIFLNLFDNFMSWKGEIIILIINSLFFTVIHMRENIFYFLNTFIHSFIYGAVYMYSKSIKYPILLHCANNTVALFSLALEYLL